MFVLGNIIGSVFWGLMIAVVLTCAVFAICWRLNRIGSSLTWLVLAVLLLFLCVQGTMMVGAMYAKGYVADISQYASGLASTATDATQRVADFEHLRREIGEEYPMSKPILDNLDINVSSLPEGSTVVDAIISELESTINYYILRRLLWLIGAFVLSLTAILLLNKPRDYTIDINNLETIY